MKTSTYTIERKSAVKNGIGRMAMAVFSMFLEIWLLFRIILTLSENAVWFYMIIELLSICLVLYIYGRRTNAAMKMPWIILIIAMPIFGVTLYCLIGLNGSTRKMTRRYEKINRTLMPMLPKNSDVISDAEKVDMRVANMARFLAQYAGYPAYRNTKVSYYDDALKGLNAQLEELKKAKHFIFMEYHAIEDAESWHDIQEVLCERVNAGVEVRLIYDDMGSIGFINTDFAKKMNAKGILCRVFNPFGLGLNIFLNNRDHRKITVIDGQVGFVGGYNLANEYFHRTEPFGFWKDTGIKMEGDAVQSLSVMFLEMWHAISSSEPDTKITKEDFTKHLPTPKQNTRQSEDYGGIVIPYADNPMDDKLIGEDVYINLASGAEKYVWYITPYLIITDEMIHALSLAAKRGVDVRVITPGIPDKKIIYSVTRSYYNALARNGVRIYEYTPGFCHCKMSIADDIIAICGTINMDYRSLYHHFENGCCYADNEAVLKTKNDFIEIISQSTDVSNYYTSGRGAFLRLGQMLLRLVAPLL